METKNLENKISIITGAANGIGKAIATLFALKEAYVVISDINLDRLERTKEEITQNNRIDKDKIVAIKADVTKEIEVMDMITQAVDKFGTIDILVNNAGILFPTRFDDISEKEWDSVMDVNLKGAFLCSKAAVSIMKKNRYGRIVNMSSSAGKTVSTIGGAHYTASKSGLLGLTRAMAKELASYNINVNAVCPGLVDTEMVRATISKDKIEECESSFPINRLCRPDEIAELVLFLSSDQSAYITGASIDINGGDLMV